MPYPMKKQLSSVALMVEVVSKSINEKLKPHMQDKDQRLDLCLEICDDILNTLKRGQQ